MNVEIDSSSHLPPFEQLRAQIATMIETGVLLPGTHLPTIRQLANDLGLATRTVARAYQELEQHGMVYSRVRHDTVVAEPRHRLSAPQIHTRLTDAARVFMNTARLLGVSTDDAIQALRLVEHAEPSRSSG